MPKKITPEEYSSMFAEKYPDYELLSEYLGNKEYITVRCKLDGNIWNTKPNWLNAGAGCEKCYRRKQSEIQRKNKEDYIKEAREKHNGKYDYDLCNYTTNKSYITAICPRHGEFLIRADHHLQGQGCKKCANEKNGDSKRFSNADFIEKAVQVHGDKYSYDLVKYENCDTKVKIVCPEHGVFMQTPYVHLTGHGCPHCKMSHLEREVEKILNENNMTYETQKKFDWLLPQSLDFYLPELNLGIECQGVQHFLTTSGGWGTENVILETIARDFKKKFLCDNNSLEIIYYAKDSRIMQLTSLYNSDNTCLNRAALIKKIRK